MVRIRLRRVGRKKQPSYRVVVADSRSPRDGRYIEVIGFYNPRTQPATLTVKEERALYWLSQGAQPSDPVRRIFDRLGTLGRYERLIQGEALETLVSEAEEASASQGTISPKTRYEPVSKEAKAAAKSARAKVEADSRAEEDAGGEENAAPVETEAEETAVVEAEVELTAEAEVEDELEVENEVEDETSDDEEENTEDEDTEAAQAE
jgi:small subunit ribosomal protein S16